MNVLPLLLLILVVVSTVTLPANFVVLLRPTVHHARQILHFLTFSLPMTQQVYAQIIVLSVTTAILQTANVRHVFHLELAVPIVSIKLTAINVMLVLVEFSISTNVQLQFPQDTTTILV